MAQVTMRSLNKMYDEVHAVKDVNLDIRDKEFVVLVGPSGCGKTTTLRMVAGLESITSGRVLINDKVVNELAPMDRDIAMVFQNYALYPHMSVYDNMAFGLKMRKFDKPEIQKRVREAADVLGIGEYLKRKPRQLSGGQRQRVALGRAIVRDALLFLFDEPLSNLDAQLRDDMRVEIKRLHQELGRTMIYVTHDQIEAMTLADRIALLRDGKIEQLGAPLDLFERPATRFVAGFLGSPKMNFLPATIETGEVILRDGTKLTLPPGRKAPNGQAVVLGLRPQHIAKAGASAALGHVQLPSTIELVQPTGSRVQVSMPLGGISITAEFAAHEVTAPGERVRIDIDMTRAVLIDPQTDKVI